MTSSEDAPEGHNTCYRQKLHYDKPSHFIKPSLLGDSTAELRFAEEIHSTPYQSVLLRHFSEQDLSYILAEPATRSKPRGRMALGISLI